MASWSSNLLTEQGSNNTTGVVWGRGYPTLRCSFYNHWACCMVDLQLGQSRRLFTTVTWHRCGNGTLLAALPFHPGTLVQFIYIPTTMMCLGTLFQAPFPILPFTSTPVYGQKITKSAHMTSSWSLRLAPLSGLPIRLQVGT